MATCNSSGEKKTGFDCEFVQRPPEAIQKECPVCLQVLREPYQAPCCGNSFCRACIEKIKISCPTCKEKDFTTFHNKGLQRSLYGLHVYCSHKQEGCEWKGELGQLDIHLNLSPQPDKQLEGCDYSEIECIYCSELIKRSNIAAHQTEHCDKRPFSCEYCHSYESHYEDVTKDCPKAKTAIACNFHHVGGDVKLPRKDMPAYLKENLVTHMSLQAANYSKLQASHKELQASHATLQADYNELRTSLEEMRNNQRCTEESVRQQVQQVQRERKQSFTGTKGGLFVSLTLAVLALALFAAYPSGEKELRASIEEKINQLEVNQKETQASQATLHGSNKELQTSHATLQGSYKELQTSHTSLKDSHKELQASHATLQGSHKELQTSYTTLQGSYRELQTSCATLQGSHRELQASIAILQSSLRDLQSSHRDLQTSIPMDRGHRGRGRKRGGHCH